VKTRLLFIALLFAARVEGQEKNTTYSAFAIDNKEVIWVQVYHAQQPVGILSQQVHDFLKHKAWVKNLRADGSEIVIDLENFRVDYKRYGGRYMNTSNLIRTARWSGKARISFKEGKYRVIVYGLEYDARQPAMHAGKMNNQSHMIHGSFTDWVLNKYRSHFRKSRHINMDILHAHLKESFTLTETEFVDEDW
jgi:hypothetical protein